MATKKNIAGVVVLYNPSEDVLDCIQTYNRQVDKLYAVDNSDTPSDLSETIKGMANVKYISLHGNHGIARALNVGAEAAISEEYDFLLSMDQDSRATPDLVDTLITSGPAGDPALGMLAPFPSIAVDPSPKPGEPDCMQVLTAWTSGSLLRLAAYRKVGPFNDDYFIDFVDHEYCMRLNLASYKVFKINRAILRHNIGNDTHRQKFLWLEFIVSNHSALRRYYITRNRFHLASRMAKHFPQFFWEDKRAFLAELACILLFEREKIQKFMMITRGYIDYRRSSLGKYNR